MRFRILPLLALTTACATTGATFKSGVGDTYFDHPPFYAGSGVASGTVGWLPIVYQRGTAMPAMFDLKSDAGTPVATLLDDMNRYLDSLGVAKRLVVTASRGTPPDVQFGCRTNGMRADDCVDRDSLEGAPRGIFNKDVGALRLAVGRPSKDWTAWADSAMVASDVGATLVISLEIGDYYLQQKGLKGSKQVELGTDYTVSFPWMTSLDTPVNVVQLTGALMDRGGKALRIGAEGLLAKRTSFKVSVLGAQTMVTDDDIAELRSARRTDLPGQPLVWQVGLRNLVGELTGR